MLEISNSRNFPENQLKTIFNENFVFLDHLRFNKHLTEVENTFKKKF